MSNEELCGEIKALRRELAEMKKDTQKMTKHIDFMETVYQHLHQPINAFLQAVEIAGRFIAFEVENTTGDIIPRDPQLQH